MEWAVTVGSGSWLLAIANGRAKVGFSTLTNQSVKTSQALSFIATMAADYFLLPKDAFIPSQGSAQKPGPNSCPIGLNRPKSMAMVFPP